MDYEPRSASEWTSSLRSPGYRLRFGTIGIASLPISVGWRASHSSSQGSRDSETQGTGQRYSCPRVVGCRRISPECASGESDLGDREHVEDTRLCRVRTAWDRLPTGVAASFDHP